MWIVNLIIVLCIVVTLADIFIPIIQDHRLTRYKRKNLNINARITDVKTEVVGQGREKRLRTLVTFEDGFKYLSYAAEVKERIFSTKYIVNFDVREEIIRQAIRKHAKLLGYPIPNRPPQVCSKCNLMGPFYGEEERCPLCGCSTKKDL